MRKYSDKRPAKKEMNSEIELPVHHGYLENNTSGALFVVILIKLNYLSF